MIKVNKIPKLSLNLIVLRNLIKQSELFVKPYIEAKVPGAFYRKDFKFFTSKKYRFLYLYPSETLVAQGFSKPTLKISTFTAPPLVNDFCLWYNIVVRWEIFHRTGFDNVFDCVDGRIPGSSIRMGSGVQNGKQSMPKGINDFLAFLRGFSPCKTGTIFWLFWRAYAFAELKRFLEALGELCSFEEKLITGTETFIGF